MSLKNILVFSYENESSLELNIAGIISNLCSLRDSEIDLNEFCSLHNSSQSSLSPKRVAVIGNSIPDFVNALNSRSFIYPLRTKTENSRLCFQFTGQGSQYVGMGDRLYSSCSIYRDNFDKCSFFLKSKFGLDLARIPVSVETTYRKYAASLIPAFVLQVCLARTWQSWGIRPDFVLTHSLGEYAAAVFSGLMSLEDGLTFLAAECWFTRLILPNSRMLVLMTGEENTTKLLKRLKDGKGNGDIKLEIAVINSPTQVVVGGHEESIKAFNQLCNNENIKSTLLPGGIAFHTKAMRPIVSFCKRAGGQITFKNEPEIPYISGMTGELVREGEVSGSYWCKHFISKVNFLKASETALDLGADFLVEIGPRPVLSNLIVEINAWRNMKRSETNQITCVHSLKAHDDDWTTIVTNLAKLYVSGWDVDWNCFHKSMLNEKN